MKATTANARGNKAEATASRGGDERFVLTAGGEVLAVLPGCLQSAPEGRLLALERGAVCEGVAGAGSAGVSGWFRYRCALIAPRRFAARCGEALINGKDADEILRETARTALEEALRENGADAPRALWTVCRKRLEDALLDIGWQLRSFRPGPLPIGKGGGR